MARPSSQIVLSAEGRRELERLARAPRTQARYAQRAQIVLLASEGLTNKEIAERLRTRSARVSKWRTRFAAEGANGLCDDFRPGVTPRYDETTEQRILAKLDEPPPAGYARWNGVLLAKALGDVSDDVVGLYLDPPENAIVISVDEKPCIQALERAQGWLKMPDGRALSGFAHEYKRHGTTTLFAALEVATGRIYGECKSRKRRKEFLAFLAGLEAAHPDKDLHVGLDNLSTHRISDPAFWRKHPRLHFHFTPTHASWLNQVEVWFSMLSAQSLRGASFTAVKELIAHIQAFIAAYNQNCVPFDWRKINPEVKSFSSKYSNICK